jgi:WD40 repeat protein
MRCIAAIALVFLAGSAYISRAQELATPKFSLDTHGELRGLAFSPDGKLLATVSGTDTAVRLWDAATGKQVTKLSTGTDPGNYVGKSSYGVVMPRVGFMQLGFSPDARLLAVLAEVTNDLRLWDVQTGKLYTTFTGVRSMMTAEFSPDGKLFALAAGGQGLKLIDVYAGRLLTTKWDFNHVLSVTAAGFSKDGATLIVGVYRGEDAEGGFYFVDVASGRIKAAILSPPSHNLTGQASLDRSSMVTFENSSNDVKIWDLTTGVLKSTISGGKSRLSDVSISPDGKTVVTMTKDGKVQLWDGETSEPKAALQTQGERVSFIIFSPDGKSLVTVDKKVIKIRDSSTGLLKQSLTNARAPIGFSPDGRLLVTAMEKGGAQVWQIQ